jgi:hypothetical protein
MRSVISPRLREHYGTYLGSQPPWGHIVDMELWLVLDKQYLGMWSR